MSQETEEPTPPNDEPPTDDIGTATKAAALIGGVLAVGALPLSGPRAAVSVLVGAAIAVANLLSMRAIIRAVVRSPQEGPSTAQALWALFAALKILLLFGGIWFLLTRRLVDPIPLVVGYGVLPLGIVASAVWSSRRR